MKERLRKHNSNHNGFTGGNGDCRAVYIESFASKEEAYFRELEVKVWKQETLNLAGSEHPAL